VIDIGLSPDVPAYWCYALVFVLGFIGACRQLSTQLAGRAGIWAEPRVHLLLALYAALPIGLFWLLDRAGAVVDTALIGAVLVGVGYRQIVAGGDGTIKAPTDMSRFWAMFQAYADPIAKQASSILDARDRREEDRLIRTIARTDGAVERLIDVARQRLPAPDVLDAQLGRVSPQGPADASPFVLEQRARIVMGLLLQIPDRDRLVREAGILPAWRYWIWAAQSYARLGGVYYRTLYALLLGILILLGPEWGSPTLDYHIWRVGKANATPADQFRAREWLVGTLTRAGPEAVVLWPQPDPPTAARALGRELRRPGLSADRVDLILQILLEARATIRDPRPIDAVLVDALHAGNVDTRRRINDALLTLAKATSRPLPEDLSGWKAAESDAAASLEQRIIAWQRFWDVLPKP
jgi:hypothetical protein